MTKRCKRVQWINTGILWAYMMFIFLADYIQNKNPRFSVLFIWLIQMAVLFAIGCPLILKGIRIVHISSGKAEGKRLNLCFGIEFTAAMSIMLVFYAAYYPGTYSSDPMWQIEQAIIGVYNDWHPVLHTLLSYKIPLMLTDGWVGSVVLFQMLELSLAIAYAATTVYEYTNLRTSILVLGFMILNPVTGSIALNPWKDVAVAIIALLMMTMAIRVHMTGGQWLRKPVRVFLLAALLAVTTIVRHNAILFTVPLLLAFCLYIEKKQRIQICILFLSVILLVKGPLYSALDVQKPDSRQIETLGLPMTVIGNVVKESPESLDEEMREFVYAIAPQEMWETYYQCGDFNQIKWREGVNLNVIEEAGAAKVLRLTIKAFVRAPGEALRGLLGLTGIVYSIGGSIHWWPENVMAENDLGLAYHGIPACVQFVSDYVEASSDILRYVFWSVGAMNLVVLICILAKTRFTCIGDLKRMLLALPMLIYNYGTMLLLTGHDFRFFYFSFMITPLIMVLMLREREPDKACG